MLYAFSKFGWGHTSRCLKIARQIEALGRPAIVVCSQGELPAAQSSPFPVVVIPGYEYVGRTMPTEIPREGLQSSLAGWSVNQLAEHRADLVARIVQYVNAAVVYVDSFPFHPEVSAAECLAPLRAARRLGARTVSGFRGCLSRPLTQDTLSGIRSLLQTWIDDLLIFVDAQESPTVAAACPFLPPNAAYCGYVAWNDDHRGPTAQRRGVVATFGAGIDGFRPAALVLSTFRNQLRQLAAIEPLTLVAGARLPEMGLTRLQALAREPHIQVVSTVSDPVELYRRARVCVTMAGYNTCVDLLVADARAIALPRCSKRNREQLTNAQKFRGYGVFDAVLFGDDLTAERLAEAVMRAVSTPVARESRAVSLEGARNAAGVMLAGL